MSRTFCLKDTFDVLFYSNIGWEKKTHVMWYAYQYATMIPIYILGFCRLYKQPNNEDYYKKDFKANIWDKLMKVYTFFYIAYYFITFFPNIVEYNTPCRLLTALHHVCSVVGGIDYIRLDYFPWFTLLPLGIHSTLLYFPDHFELCYVYIISIYVSYYALSQEPFNSKVKYQKMKRFILSLITPLILMYLYHCDNVLDLTE
jgi:hypothetical protein